MTMDDPPPAPSAGEREIRELSVWEGERSASAWTNKSTIAPKYGCRPQARAALRIESPAILCEVRRNRALHLSLRASETSVAINNLGNPKRSIAAPASQARNDDWNPNKDSNPCHCEATAEAINRLRMFNTFGYHTRLIASLTLAMTRRSAPPPQRGLPPQGHTKAQMPLREM